RLFSLHLTTTSVMKTHVGQQAVRDHTQHISLWKERGNSAPHLISLDATLSSLPVKRGKPGVKQQNRSQNSLDLCSTLTASAIRAIIRMSTGVLLKPMG